MASIPPEMRKVMDRKKKPGDDGYIQSIRKSSGQRALLFLGLSLGLYYIGSYFFEKLALYFTIGSLFVLAVVAMYLARWFSFAGYPLLSREQYQALQAISDEERLLAELPLILKGKEYRLASGWLGEKQIYLYYQPIKDRNVRRLEIETELRTILATNQVGVPVQLMADFEQYRTAIKQAQELIKADALEEQSDRIEQIKTALRQRCH